MHGNRILGSIGLAVVALVTAGCRGGILTRASSYDKLLIFPSDGQPLSIDKLVDRFPELRGVVVKVEDYLEEVDREGPTSVAQSMEYTVEPEVTLRIDVTSEPQLSKSYVVGPQGYVDFPLIRQVQCVGRTLPQISQDIETRLRQFLKSPEVLVNLEREGGLRNELRTGATITIMGVGISGGGSGGDGFGGQLVYVGNQTLIKTIGPSLAENADWRAVRVIRKVPGQRWRSRIIICDVWKYVALGDQRQDLQLRAGDVVYVPQKWTLGEQFEKDWDLTLKYMSGVQSMEGFRRFVKSLSAPGI